MWVIQQQSQQQQFLDHINQVDPAIKFTVEGNQENGAIPFLDTLVTPLAENSLSFQVYCKPTHTDQYLQWDSHHSLSSKYSIIGTLTHRVKVVCTSSDNLQGELQHLRRALSKCNYPSWAIKKVQNKVLNYNQEDSNNNNPNENNNNNGTTTQSDQQNNSITTASHNKQKIGHIVIPYTKGTSESIK